MIIIISNLHSRKYLRVSKVLPKSCSNSIARSYVHEDSKISM